MALHTPIIWIALLTLISQQCAAAAELWVSPADVKILRPEASQQILLFGKAADGRQIDLTRNVRYQSLDTEVAIISPTGRIQPIGNGQTSIVIVHGERQLELPVHVAGFSTPPPVSFAHDLVPILSKSGCNSGGCHGKAEGQNGFKLSVFGFDATLDYDALTKEGRGRRVTTAAAGESLVLKKAAGQLPHGGGVKIHSGTSWFRLFERWIEEGANFTDDVANAVVAIEVEPRGITIEPEESQQLRVTAIDGAGNRRCVTAEAEYLSNADQIAGASRSGLISVAGVPGEAAILVRYMGQVAVCRLTLPQEIVKFPRPPENNFVDRHVWDKLEGLGISPSGTSEDAAFLRRVYLDTIGSLPTSKESQQFLVSDSPTKRAELIQALLNRDEYAAYWAMRWSDILRVDKDRILPEGAVAITRWLKRQFQENTPFDEFARQIITSQGNTLSEGPAAFYHAHDKAEEMARSISQLFLGIRIECAECHHHPFEKWGQADYYALAGFFSGVSKKPAANGGQKIFVQPGADFPHPRTSEPVLTAGLGAEPAAFEGVRDRREVLANWVTDVKNPFFARAIVNRLWAHYLGRGLFEPIDDQRDTNPATNEPLLEALAQHLIDLKFDIKAFTATLLNSQVYQLSAKPNESNVRDEQNFSHATWKALPAEVLLDAISQATDVPEEFNGWPVGYRAIEIWDSQMPSYFFRIFGRPVRATVCECERGNEPSIAQALHLMNSPESVRKIRHRDGRASQLAASSLEPSEIVRELYLAVLARFPTELEANLMLQAFEESQGNRRQAAEDILWTLLNTKEFVYNH